MNDSRLLSSLTPSAIRAEIVHRVQSHNNDTSSIPQPDSDIHAQLSYYPHVGLNPNTDTNANGAECTLLHLAAFILSSRPPAPPFPSYPPSSPETPTPHATSTFPQQMSQSERTHSSTPVDHILLVQPMRDLKGRWYPLTGAHRFPLPGLPHQPPQAPSRRPPVSRRLFQPTPRPGMTLEQYLGVRPVETPAHATIEKNLKTVLGLKSKDVVACAPWEFLLPVGGRSGESVGSWGGGQSGAWLLGQCFVLAPSWEAGHEMGDVDGIEIDRAVVREVRWWSRDEVVEAVEEGGDLVFGVFWEAILKSFEWRGEQGEWGVGRNAESGGQSHGVEVDSLAAPVAGSELSHGHPVPKEGVEVRVAQPSVVAGDEDSLEARTAAHLEREKNSINRAIGNGFATELFAFLNRRQPPPLRG